MSYEGQANAIDEIRELCNEVLDGEAMTFIGGSWLSAAVLGIIRKHERANGVETR